MNNTCPSCGAAYPIKPEHVGRKTTCKNCTASLIVTEAGLELRHENGPKSTRMPPSLAPRAPEAVVTHDEYVEEEVAPSRTTAKKKTGGVGDFLAFRRMVVPLVIQIVFWFLTGVSLLGYLAFFVISLLSGKLEVILSGLAMLVIGFPLSVLLIRMYCELIIVIFRMNDTLTNIHNELREQRRG